MDNFSQMSFLILQFDSTEWNLFNLSTGKSAYMSIWLKCTSRGKYEPGRGEFSKRVTR